MLFIKQKPRRCLSCSETATWLLFDDGQTGCVPIRTLLRFKAFFFLLVFDAAHVNYFAAKCFEQFLYGRVAFGHLAQKLFLAPRLLIL